MSSHTHAHALFPPALRVTASRQTVTLVLTAVALALMTAGGMLPWLVLFNGLTAVGGFSLDGGALAGVMLATVAILWVQSRHGGARLLRPVAVIASTAVVADSLYSAWRIAGFAAAPGTTGVLTMPSPGVGPYVFAAAGAVLVAAALVAPAAPGRLRTGVWARLVLCVVLLVASTIHLILTPEHLGISPLLGTGFLVAGVAQLVLAATALGIRNGAGSYALSAIIVVNVALIGIYVYAVLVGLPIEAGHAADDAGGLAFGAGEPVDVKGGIDLLAELAAVAIASVLASRQRDAASE